MNTSGGLAIAQGMQLYYIAWMGANGQMPSGDKTALTLFTHCYLLVSITSVAYLRGSRKPSVYVVLSVGICKRSNVIREKQKPV